MFKRIGCSLAAACVAAGLLLTPAQAQSAADNAVRLQQLEDQVRLLMGQVEQLTFEVKQLKKQVSGAKSGALDAPAAAPAEGPPLKTLTEAPADAAPADQVIASQPLTAPSGTEQIVDNGQLGMADSGALPQARAAAPGPQILGSMNAKAATPGDGGFQGEVLVAPSQQDGVTAVPQQDVAQLPMTQQSLPADPGTGDGVSQVSVSPDTAAALPDSAESLYKQSYDFMMQRRFDEAQQGFSSLVQRFPNHDLVGPSYYWLGETYFSQSQYKQAAEQFLTVYKSYPKSSKAPDSMVKLGIALVKLGNSQQGCAVYDSVAGQFPKAAQAIKRAQLEAKRAGCGA